MPRYWDFALPTQIHFGAGSARKIGNHVAPFGTSAMIVGYADRTGLEATYDRCEQALAKDGIQATTFYTIPPDPAAELVEQAAEQARAAGVDVVIGLGGGSVIDAAKGIAALVKMGGRLWDYTGANPQSKPITDSLPLVAVPTTAGTGTEVSNVAVFTHADAGSMPGDPIKASVAGPAVRPTLAVIDPDLAVGSPSRLTAACGADALGHAVEACLSRRANPISSTLAGRAVALIVANLPQAVSDPDDPAPREPLALAATLAGAAFGAAGVVVPHAIAQALGGVLHVPHGLGVALGTRLSLAFNRQACTAQYAELARCCQLGLEDDETLADRFVVAIDEMLDRCGISGQIEVPADAPADLLDRLVRNAYDSTPVPITLNPRKIAEEDMRGFFEHILGQSGN